MSRSNESHPESRPQRIIASEVTIVDRRGRPRIRMHVDDDGAAAVKFFDGDEGLRMALYFKEPGEIEDRGAILMDEREAGLIISHRGGAPTIRLGILPDGFSGALPRLEIIEGAGHGRRRHRFPPRPPQTDD